MNFNCPLCSSGTTAEIDTEIRHAANAELRVRQCDSCDVQFLHPMDEEKKLAAFYDGEYRKEYVNDGYYNQQEMEKFFAASLPEARQRVIRVQSQLLPTDEIVEIGCASGYFLAAIAPFVKTACGTEWDTPNAKFAQSKGFSVRKDIRDFAAPFDKIFLFHVLEHIRDPIAFLAELRPLLKKNGSIYLEVPNRDDVLLKTYQLKQFSDFYYQTAHLWYFNRKSLEYVCRQAGWSAEIMPLQRYDFSNHVHWMTRGVPGGQGKYRDLFSAECDRNYVESLANHWQTDTLFCILREG
jgi:2-polyprenyl-3-methyl-5-hydroxy-6-metoxy-1,4-benzoquinol methylase